jgi:Rrf2 family protein
LVQIIIELMQLTRAADYAVRVMIHMASQPEGTVISKSMLAKVADAPESFLSKILQALARAGMIRARRGVEGGFYLLPPGAQASLLDVVESIDGPIALNLCLASADSCLRQSDCAATEVWRQAQSAMLAVLRKSMIAELVPSRRGGALVNVAPASAEGKRESGKPSTAGARPRKVTAKARSVAAPVAAARSIHKNIERENIERKNIVRKKKI